ncbi:L-asparaginase [Pluteus cervinus]|uniref:L-asparaginase n=1 Tax=Pluteus cervinus TaxID=181527 RepID=A0ACD3BDW7_9AGAR|nr:L-asparaginase [Pluteus cervinus]
MNLSQPANESRVLVIYTGGTIGMLVGNQGYVPEPYFLTETLRSQSRFHDPFQDSLFSNSATVEGFREWSSNSGRATPSPGSPISTRPPIELEHHHPTLAVRSSRPIGYTSSLDPNSSTRLNKNEPVCTRISDSVYEAHLPSLVTPHSAVPGGGGSKSIRYAVLEWNPLLDSSNLEIEDWVRIATEIELNYATFDAFVILHGTDTMSYTSSALSFMLEDLGKTVILTGAQIPLSQLRNDAVDNLMGALTIAGHYIIPECCLYFNHTLFRGNRVSKTSSYDLSAFSSPNFPPLVNVGIDIVVNWDDVIRQTSLRRFKAHKVMSPYVATLRLFPGIAAATVSAFFMPPIRGVILETFGAGNAPERADLAKALKDASDRGVVVVAISQCTKGTVSDAYQTGRNLIQAGVIPGCDMTPECALTKLGYLLSKSELSVQEVRQLMGNPLRGELTRSSISPLAPQPSTVEQNLDTIQLVLSKFVRLSRPPSSAPQIIISEAPGLDKPAEDATAPWSWTAGEAASTEAVLFPFLIHLAAARDDAESISYCIETASGSVVNSFEPGSGRSPLHIAAMNGHVKSVDTLLRSGALVHLRDTLGHTALYYAARQSHEQVVDLLVEAGARLAGLDMGYVSLAVQNAIRAGDEKTLRTWSKAGVDIANVYKDPVIQVNQ